MRGREGDLGVLRGSDAEKCDCDMFYRRIKTEIEGCRGTLAVQRRIPCVETFVDCEEKRITVMEIVVRRGGLRSRWAR
jgi:hypothetical protein